MSKPKLNFRQLLLILNIETSTLRTLFGDDNKYKKLIEVLDEFDHDDDKSFPSQKEIMNSLGVNRKKLMDLMKGLYADFTSVIRYSLKYRIKKTEVRLCFETRTGYFWTVSPDKLDFIPSKGDRFQVSFIRDELGQCYFEVQNIHHEIAEQKHEITIFMKDEFILN